MEVVKKRSLTDLLHGSLLICHPLPVLFHTFGVTAFAILASWPNLNWSLILLVIGAHTAMQLSIAILNDYCDRELDAASRPGKPIPAGLVQPREALISGVLLIGLMFLLLLPLPRAALLISLAYLVLGQLYNLGLKSTPFSGLLFALAIPLIPLYAFAAFGRSSPLLLWLVPVGALLGVALNLANSLPDVEDDAAHGARTLAVVLGVQRTFSVCQCLILGAALLIGGLTWTRLVPALGLLIYPVTALVMLLCVSLLLAFRTGIPLLLRRRYFYLVVATCLVLAGSWLIGAL